MTIEDFILRDLVAGQSTASSIAGRLKKQTPAILAILTRLETEGKVISFPLSVLTIWKLKPTNS